MKRITLAIVCLVAGALVGSYVFGPVLHGQAPGTPAIPKELTSYRDVVKKVLPAVVSLEAKFKQQPQQPPAPNRPRPDDPRVPEEFRRFFEEFERNPFGQMPEAQPRLGFGSGTIIDPKGVILTNYHVVAGAEEVVVQLLDGRKFVSRDIRGDRRTDLAIVKVEAKDGKPLPHLQLGDSEQMEIGDRVLAVGAPFGLAGSVTHGIISGKGRSGLAMNMYEDFLQTDAAINPGNSGGPLVNLEGKVVGINAAIKSRSGGFQGVGLAVSSNLASSVVKALLTDGVVRRGYLGVQVRELAPEVAERLGVAKGTGVVVADVYKDTPAAKANLKAGDVITAIAGKPVPDGKVLQTIVAGLPLNQAAEVQIVRDGQAQKLAVTIEEQPESFGTTTRVPAPLPPRENPQTVGVEKLGIELADLNERLADELGYARDVRGAVITRVEPNGAGAQGGLRRGMLILQVDRQAVGGAAAAREALTKASLERGILLQVRSPQGGTTFVLLQAGGN
jgi:serine protease Do